MLRKRSTFVAILLLSACAPAATRPATRIRDPESLVYAIHDRHGRSWYQSVAANQRVTLRRGGSTVVEHWTTYAMAGRLRVETDSARTNGELRVRDSVFVIRDRRVAARWEEPNLVVAFGLDIFQQHPRETLDQLADYGFLPGALRTDSWQGQPAYVVSAAARDGRTRELWVEARRLLPVRVVEPLPGGRTREIRFENYQPRQPRAWLAERVEIREDGELVQLAEYDGAVTSAGVAWWIFEPGRWSVPFAVSRFSRGNYIDASDMGNAVSYH